VTKFKYFGNTVTNKIALMNRLRAEWTQQMSATIQGRIFFVSLLSKYMNIQIYMGVKLGLSHWGENIGGRCFEKRMCRKILEPKRNGIIGEWSKLHDEELYYLYSLSVFTRVIKSRKIRWLGHVACMGVRKVHTDFWWEASWKETT
jgi:hypothetical protein